MRVVSVTVGRDMTRGLTSVTTLDTATDTDTDTDTVTDTATIIVKQDIHTRDSATESLGVEVVTLTTSTVREHILQQENTF